MSEKRESFPALIKFCCELLFIFEFNSELNGDFIAIDGGTAPFYYSFP